MGALWIIRRGEKRPENWIKKREKRPENWIKKREKRPENWIKKREKRSRKRSQRSPIFFLEICFSLI